MKKYPNSDFRADTYYRQPQFKQQLYKARLAGMDILTNEIRKLNNTRWAMTLKGKIRIQDILRAGWPSFKSKNISRLQRPGLIESVERAIDCGNPDKGFLFLECTGRDCPSFTIVPFTCKSRFCASCGKKYRDARAAKISETLLDVPHRQFVFSLPCDMRILFRIHHELLDILFKTVEETFTEAIFGDAKHISRKEHRQLGFHSFLHTYGRDLKWHPHLHVLIAESYLSNDGTMHHISLFPFDAMRLWFKYLILSNVRKWLKENHPEELGRYRTLERKMNAKYPKGFYIYGPRMKSHRIGDMRALAKYVARYASHPPISEGRIDAFDKEKMTVSWHYDPHEDDDCEEPEMKKGRQFITESVEKFLERLIVHVPDARFQQIRHYGFYAGRCRTTPKCRRMSTERENREARRLLRWEHMLMAAYGYSKMICECGARMQINFGLSYFPDMEDRIPWRSSG